MLTKGPQEQHFSDFLGLVTYDENEQVNIYIKITPVLGCFKNELAM